MVNIENVVKSANYLDFINKIDMLIHELLYSEQGYTMLKSKEAIKNASDVVQTFENEAQKLINEFEISKGFDIVENKKLELQTQVKKHYDKQIFVWVDEIFEELVENSLFSLSLDKEKADLIENRIMCAISWVCEIKEFDEAQKNALIEQMLSKIRQTLISNDEDYIPSYSPQKSDNSLFLKLRNLVIENEDEFLQIDLSKFVQKLSKNDMNYFLSLKNTLKTSKNTSIKDEINLVNSAIEVLKLKDDDEKFDFIKQVNNDFNLFIELNKKIEDKDKIDIVKKRIKIYSNDNKKSNDYYKKQLTVSSNE